jgi:hypothetical protein
METGTERQIKLVRRLCPLRGMRLWWLKTAVLIEMQSQSRATAFMRCANACRRGT